MPFGNLKGWRIGDKKKGKYARTVAFAPRKVAKIAQKVVQRNQELKYYVLSYAAATQNATSTITDLLVPTQGVPDTSRVGDRIKLASTMWICYSVTVAANITSTRCRVILFQWHPSSQLAIPTAANILLVGPTGAIDTFSPYIHDLRSQFKILYDKVHTLSSVTNYEDGVKRNISLKGASKQCQFYGAGTNSTNVIYALFISDQVGGNSPTIEFQSKIWFRDG